MCVQRLHLYVLLKITLIMFVSVHLPFPKNLRIIFSYLIIFKTKFDMFLCSVHAHKNQIYSRVLIIAFVAVCIL